MPNRTYVCESCGAMRRAAAIYLGPGGPTTEANAHASPSWPKHCDRPMAVLSDVQAEGASQLTDAERVGWLSKGGHVLRHRGKHKWKPALSEREVEEARRQLTTFRGTLITRPIGVNPRRRGRA